MRSVSVQDIAALLIYRPQRVLRSTPDTLHALCVQVAAEADQVVGPAQARECGIVVEVRVCADRAKRFLSERVLAGAQTARCILMSRTGAHAADLRAAHN